MLIGLLIVLACLAAGGFLYLQQAKFGRLPQGGELAELARSPNYQDGEFRNLEPIPEIVRENGFFGAWMKFLFSSDERRVPSTPLPAVKTDLKSLDLDSDTVIWLGHSSYYMHLNGKRILVDPVFSDHAAPISLVNRAFPGSSLYTAEDMPDIDYLLITHDHWDHLDYPSVTALRSRVGKVFCPLGVDVTLEYWGYAPEQIQAGDWYTAWEAGESLTVHILPARHFSGRLLTRNKTLWAAFALETPERRIFLSGDSGYGAHFEDIGRRFDGFDLVILDNGQYNEDWRYVHMMPEDAAQAAEDLRAQALLPAHVGRFSIAYHSWDDPFIRLANASLGRSYRLLTPIIGEPVNLAGQPREFSRWWEEVEQPSSN